MKATIARCRDKYFVYTESSRDGLVKFGLRKKYGGMPGKAELASRPTWRGAYGGRHG